jgi:hypothetical protein
MVNVLSKLEVNVIFRFLPPPLSQNEHFRKYVCINFFICVYVNNSFLKFVQAF